MSVTAILIAVCVGYVALLAVLAVLAQPLRIRLANLADELADEPGRSQPELYDLEWMVESSSSSVVGMMIPIAAIYIIATALLGGRMPGAQPELARLYADPRYDKAVGYYFVSVAAGSPLAAVISLPLILLATLVLTVCGEKDPVKAAEAAVLKASNAFQPC